MGKNSRILIIDDDSEVRESYKTILSPPPAKEDVLSKGVSLFDRPMQESVPIERKKYDLTMVESGEGGVEAVEKTVEKESPFVAAFIDMKMPGLDGAETSKRIWAVDRDIKIVIVTAYSEYTPDDIIRVTGREDILYLRKPFNPEEIRQFARSLTNQWGLEHERELLSEKINQANAQLSKYAKDLNSTVLKLKNEVEERKKAEEELRQAKEAAEVANRAKSELISNVSHELRTPLASILGFTATILGDKEMPEETRTEFLEIIHKEGKRLGQLIEDLLDIARIESGEIDLNLNTNNATELLDDLERTIRGQFDVKGVHLEIMKPSKPILAVYDSDRITQVIQNLLSNSLKFTPSGGSVLLSLEERGEREILFTVKDTGVGIPENDLIRVFEKFYRVDWPNEKNPGTGLGLAITKEIVEKHGGEIWVKSVEGTSSTFRFTLPVS